MIGDRIVPAIYLTVSVVALLVHSWAFTRLCRARAARELTRTTACRVAVSLLYILVGVNALTRNWAPLQLALGVFAVTQVTWIVNSVLDKRTGTPKRPRSRRFIQIIFTREPDRTVPDDPR